MAESNYFSCLPTQSRQQNQDGKMRICLNMSMCDVRTEKSGITC